MADRKPSDVLKDSISALKALSADMDTEQAMADEANKQITVLGTKVQAAALDAIVSRSQNLETLTQALDAVLAKAGHNDSSESVSKVRGFLAEAKTFIDMPKRG